MFAIESARCPIPLVPPLPAGINGLSFISMSSRSCIDPPPPTRVLLFTRERRWAALFVPRRTSGGFWAGRGVGWSGFAGLRRTNASAPGWTAAGVCGLHVGVRYARRRVVKEPKAKYSNSSGGKAK